MRQPSYGSEEWFEWYSEDPEVVLRRVESGEIPVDSGIRAMVVDANRRGLTTHSCCDGHGNDFAYITFKPWVDPQAISDWYDDCGVAACGNHPEPTPPTHGHARGPSCEDAAARGADIDGMVETCMRRARCEPQTSRR